MRISNINQRRHVTLIEMLIVLVLLSMLAGVVGINVVKAMREQRFRSEVQVVVDQLRLAQDLMLIAGVDVHLKFAQDVDKKGIKFWMEANQELSENWSREVQRPHNNLTTVQYVEFEDFYKLPFESGVIDLRFLSGGSVMSRGVLRLSTSASKKYLGALEKYVCLPGYPAPIVTVNSDEECGKGEEDKDEALTRYMIEEINGKALE